MMKGIVYIAALAMLIVQGCKNSSETTDESQTEVKTPVTFTAVEHSSISEYIQLSATSVYQKKNQVKSSTNGYIEKSSARIGEYVEAGKPLYYIRTKEAEVLRKFHENDTSYKITGLIVIKAPESGILTEVVKFTNDYVSDGDPLATIAEQNSFVFILNVPFEQKKYAPVGTVCNVLLPDSTNLQGTVISQLSMVDPVSQTQSYAVKVNSISKLPENLVATVRLVKHTKSNTQILDKSCVLTDETMEKFWVMKLINDSTAVKVPVKKGISTDDKIEILSPVFNASDRIINSGQYGLADTANVTINK
jgi:multidrug efflux pump subunit AcrA (membrane-fusion protein)